jgi:acetylglutamate kinase
VLDRNKELIQTMDEKQTLALIEEGTIEGGMYPKVKCCLKALRGGVKKAHIVDGRLKHTILLEMFTDRGIGTQIVL